MKAKIYLILEILLFISTMTLIFVFENDLVIWSVICKTTASLFFVLIGLCGYKKEKENKNLSRLLLMALICSMAGDIFLALDKNEGILFIFGVISFAMAHILFSATFCKISNIQKKDLLISILIFIILMIILFSGNLNFQGLLPVLIGYTAILSFMTAKALSLWYCKQENKRFTYLLTSGGVIFLISDIILLFWLFGAGDVPKELQSVNWFFYYFAQGCFSAALNVQNTQS